MTEKLAGQKKGIEDMVERQGAEIEAMREANRVEESEEEKAERSTAIANLVTLRDEYQADLKAGKYDH